MSDHFIEIWHGNILSDEDGWDNLSRHECWTYLNDEEKQRALKFARLDLQKKFVKTRGVLRQILASYLDLKPQKIIIKTANYGKPYLTNGTLNFNLSHTGNQFVIAVSDTGDVGIDIEQYRDKKSISGLVKKCFSKVEQDYWNNLSEQQKNIMFYRFWVRKESFVKAVGRGIALGLDQCIINPEEQDYFLEIPSEYGQASSWRIIDVPIDDNSPCAVVISNKPVKYKQTRLST